MPLSLPEPSQRTRRADFAACRAALRNGSRSFFMASMLLPRAVREPACALYAFCRLADDAIDQQHGGTAAVAVLRKQLDGIYAGRCEAHTATHAVDRALAQVVERHRIPRELLDALIEGFEWDAQARRYEDFAALEAYAMRVAGTVGAMMAILMGVRDAALIARACDLGVAMQLTNIARDVGEDARNGRLYLPLSWLREVGLDPERWLGTPQFNLALASVIERLLRTAEQLYARADTGIAALPANCRPGIKAARLFYAAIGQEVERSGFDSISRRAIVPARRKFTLLLRAFAIPIRPTNKILTPSIAASEYFFNTGMPTSVPEMPLLQSSQYSQLPVPRSKAIRWWHFRQRMIQLLTLFERLERVDRQTQIERLSARS
jgi:phytoene synthase